MTACKKPKDVCPECMEHHEQVPIMVGSCFDRLVRCSGCGHVHRWCELRHYDATEAEAARDRKREYMREYARAHKDEAVRRAKLFRMENRARINADMRRRYAEDPGYRERRATASKRYDAAHPEKGRERWRRYYERHRHEIAFRRKRKLLDELREEKPCGSTS